MMHYIILSDAAKPHAENISTALYKLSAPSPESTTKNYCPWCMHPDTDEVALCVPAREDLLVSADADLQEVVGLLGVDIGQEFVDSLAEAISEPGMYSTFEILPAPLVASVKTRSQMEALGWFPSPFLL